MPSKTLRILTVSNGILSSIVILIILVNSFNSSGEKYVPAMILANKYAFPLIISALALFFLVFFEPDALQKKNVVVVFRVIFFLTFSIFSYYIFLQMTPFIFSLSFLFYFCEDLLLFAITLHLFLIPNLRQRRIRLWRT